MIAKGRREREIGALGLSEISSATLRRACKVHHIAAVRSEYTPLALDIESPEAGLLQICRELGIAVVSYSPLSRAFLPGQLTSHDDFEEGDFRKFAPRFSKENFPSILKLADHLAKSGIEKRCTPRQLSLAGVLAQVDDVIPIP
jgi:aryl-alcohol dehydrogenase-like predicted oxidoreductase